MTTTSSLTDSLHVQNVVASTNSASELALEPLGKDLDGAEYTSDTPPALHYQPAEAETTVRIFRSGTLLAMGAPSRTAARDSLTTTLTHLAALDIPVPAAPAITILNMVFTADLGTELDLPAVAVALGLDQTEYEPEQFSGLIYRPTDLTEIVLIFSTGKLVITGGTEPATAETALTAIADQLAELGLREG